MFLLVLITASATPTTVVHEGRLLDAAGGSITGASEVSFALYPAEDAAEPVWREELSVTLADGYYTVVLGNEAPLDAALLSSNLELWLGLTVGGIPLGRQPLHSVPFAVAADTSRTLSRTDCERGQILAFDGDTWECARSSGALGDVKWSLLSEDAFTAENGPGWTRWGSGSLEGTDLGELTGLSALPDPTGHFLRAIGDGGRAVASAEGWATAAGGLSVTVASGGAHTHSASSGSAGSHAHTLGVNGTDTFSMSPGGATQRLAHFRGDGYGGGGAKSTNSAGAHSHSVSVGSAGAHAHSATVQSSASETRPSNLAAHLYIKVNR